MADGFRGAAQFPQRLSHLANEYRNNHGAEKDPERADQCQHLLRGVQDHQRLFVRGEQEIARAFVLSQR